MILQRDCFVEHSQKVGRQGNYVPVKFYLSLDYLKNVRFLLSELERNFLLTW